MLKLKKVISKFKTSPEGLLVVEFEANEQYNALIHEVVDVDDHERWLASFKSVERFLDKVF